MGNITQLRNREIRIMIISECRSINHPITVREVDWQNEKIAIRLAWDFNIYLTRDEAYELLSGLESALSR